MEEITQLEDNKKAKNALLEDHLDQAKESLKYYREMREKCATQWKEILKLEQLPSLSSVQRDELQHLKNTFTLVLSADYQMNKLLPYWGRSPQPGSTYYPQKLSYDNLGIVDHRDEKGHLYLFSELIGPKNTNHTFSYILHYLRSTDKVPQWIKRVHIFLDNAGSTNKNQYMMGSVLECVQHDILSYFRVSFMIAGHTKFAPDRLFALCAKSFYASDVFSEADFSSVMGQHADVTFDHGRIVRCWRECVTTKYSNLPGIRSLHDFLAIKNPGQQAVMKVRNLVYAGPLIDTPMKLIGDYSPTTRVIPTINDTIAAKGLVKELTGVKFDHIKQMYSNFIQHEQWHELLADL